MIGSETVVVVMPAFNAERTLLRTVQEIDRSVVDHIILVDDRSSDKTVALAKELGLIVIEHEENLGYGANQKTCYKAALARQADIIIMIHPDYQYPPKLIPAIVSLLHQSIFDLVLGSRILGGKALEGGMPFYKYVANRVLTLIQNFATRKKLSEYHTGLRGYKRRVLETIPFEINSNNFVFDNQVLIQCIDSGFQIGEITCPARYFEEASSINFLRSLRYGLGCLLNTLLFVLADRSLYRVGWLKRR